MNTPRKQTRNNAIRGVDWLAAALYPAAVILMEGFCTYPWLVFLGLLPVFGGSRPAVGMFSVIGVLGLSLIVTRLFSRREWPMWLIRSAVIGSGVLVMFLVLRIEYGDRFALSGGRWAAHIVEMLSLTFHNPHPVSFAIPVILYLWWRGILLERRTASFENIYALFVIRIAGLITLIVVWLIVYGSERYTSALSTVVLYTTAFFFFGLVSLGVRNLYLKRKLMIEKQTKKSAWHSLAVIVAIVLTIAVCGIIAAGLFSPGFLDGITDGFKAFWGVITKALYYVMFPILYLTAGIFEVIKWLISLFPRAGQEAMEVSGGSLIENIDRTAKGMPQIILTILQLLAAAAITALVTYILVRAVRRFGEKQGGDAEEIHESLLSMDAVKKDLDQFLRMLAQIFKRKQKPASIHYGDETGGLSIREIYKRLLWEGGRSGVARRSSETPREYAGRLAKQLSGGTAELNEITGLYGEVRYGERELPEEQAREANGLWALLRESIRRAGEPDE